VGLFVSEIFTSIQGEGRVIGLPCLFIRLAGCNLRCTYCDTKYALEMTQGREMSVIKLVQIARVAEPKLVCITGGEPLLQDIRDLVRGLGAVGKTVMVETNGTIEQYVPEVDIWSVSPKLSNSGNPTELTVTFQKPEIVDYYKFVLSSLDDVDELVRFVMKYMIPWRKVIVQPDNSVPNYQEVSRQLWKTFSKWSAPIRYIPQLHFLIFGRKRGI